MRIAVTGTHGVGKTTLAEDLATSGSEFNLVPEPYLVFQNDATFIDGTNTQDLEEQLDQSCDLILESSDEKDNVFDRCPIDFLAYLDVAAKSEGFEWTPSSKQLARIQRTVEALDLVVFVPLLEDDEITVPIEYPKLRRQVDRRLKSILHDDEFGFLESGLRQLEVFGPREKRVATVLASLARDT